MTTNRQTMLSASDKTMGTAAREALARGRDLHDWVFRDAPVGTVFYRTPECRPGERVRGRVWQEPVGGGRVRRRSTVELVA